MNKPVVLALFLSGIIFSCYAQQSQGLSKQKTIELYKKMYLSSELKSMPWNGDIDDCICGTLDSNIYKKAENRLNFFRNVNGLNSIKNNPAFNKDAQNAALLIIANNTLTHKPANTLKCYSKSAYDGCSKSCIGITDFEYYPGTAFLTEFIEENGDRNYYVGHRRWILYSKLEEFGYGATESSEALLTTDGVNMDSIPLLPEFIAYPWNGYVPVNLIFPKWSFSIPENKKVDFTYATITMTDSAGKKIAVQKLNEYKNYLDPTIVWTAKELYPLNDISVGKTKLEDKAYLNKKIKVTISNVKVNGVIKKYEYFVVPIKI